MIIPWNIGAGVTAKNGNVKYSFRFYRLKNDGSREFEYNLNTLVANSKVLYGIGDQNLSDDDISISADDFEELL